jgi:GH24 family phage-related lysozyme (muramidase)
MTDLAEQLVGEEEGRDPCVYPDTSSQKLLTIAIGCVVDRRVPGAGLCDAAISAQFAHDSAEARAIAAQYPYYNELSEVRQAVLISMSFQLGSKPQRWPNFMAALVARNYTAAAAAGRDSDWWRIQTPKRAEREMTMLETDIWVPHA